jgi:tetratricopeptide (TPR) repeat protein
MKCKEYKEAVACYGKALDLNPTDAATFSNRAMAHLKLKEYARALEDAEAAIKLKDDYVKAYHRRGKAYLALNKIEMAIRDFQYILEKEPHNKEAMQEVKNARKKLDEKLGTASTTAASTQAAPTKNKFTRVAI